MVPADRPKREQSWWSTPLGPPPTRKRAWVILAVWLVFGVGIGSWWAVQGIWPVAVGVPVLPLVVLMLRREPRRQLLGQEPWNPDRWNRRPRGPGQDHRAPERKLYLLAGVVSSVATIVAAARGSRLSSVVEGITVSGAMYVWAGKLYMRRLRELNRQPRIKWFRDPDGGSPNPDGG